MTHPPTASGGTSKRFREDVEGLRAVAVLAVVLFHADLPGLSGGFVGVDVFFVISGFLITGLLWREVSKSGTVGLARFYGARARRLLPASALVGVVTVLAAAALLPPLRARTVIGDGIASALYVSNFRFFEQNTDYFFAESAPSPFQHYWSLGVEEQFYLVWPAVIIGTAWLVRRRSRRHPDRDGTPSVRPYLLVLILITVLSFAASLAATHLFPLAAFFLSPARAWELALGGLVALTMDHWRRLSPVVAAIIGWVGLGAILLAIHSLESTTPYPGTAALLPVVGTALVIGAGCAAPAGGGAGRLLSLPPRSAIGRVTYSWYLWHWPLLVLAPPLVGHPLGWAGKAAAVVLSGILAVLTLRLVENPFRLSEALRRSARRSLTLGAAATAIAVGVGVVLLVAVKPPVAYGPAAPALALTLPSGGAGLDADEVIIRNGTDQIRAALAAATRPRPVPTNLAPALGDAAAENLAMRDTACIRYFLEVKQPECLGGDTSSPTTVALVGDSNAAMWAGPFRQIAEERHWRLEILTKSGCPLLDLPIVSRDLRRDYTECVTWRDQILDRLQADPPKLIVVSMWRLYGSFVGVEPFDKRWTDSVTRMVAKLRATGARVLLMGAIPDPQSQVPTCVSDHLDDTTACAAERSAAVDQAGVAAEAAAAAAGGGQYADLTDLFCTTETCPVIVGNTLMYLDRSHVTPEYGQLLRAILGALADRTLIRG